MKRYVLAVMVMFLILSAGCIITGTTNTAPATTVQVTPATALQTHTPEAKALVIITTVNTTNETMAGNKTTYSPANDFFFIEPLTARNYEGDTITVHGTTILAPGDPLLVEVISSSFGPTMKSDSQFFTGVSGVVHVIQGPPGGPNTWSFSFPTSGFTPDTYIVTVSGLSVNVEDSTTFELLPRIV